MAADDVYLALVRLDDPDTRQRASDGDVEVLEGLELTDEERELVQAVIDEDEEAEVAGFAGGAMFGALNYCSGRVSPGVLHSNPASNFSFGSLVGPSWGEASCGAGTCTAEPKKKFPSPESQGF